MVYKRNEENEKAKRNNINMAFKEIIELKKKEAPKKDQRYVALRNLEKMKKFGWKIVSPNIKADFKLSRAAAKRATEDGDLVLMEK